jgi:hypothetical protein
VGYVRLMVEQHLGQGVQRAGLIGRLDHQSQGSLTLGALAHRPECIASPDYLFRSTLTPITTTSNIFYLISWSSRLPGGLNHSEACSGCIVSLTTETSSSLNASRSVSLRSWTEKASRVFLASYFLR